MDAKIQSPNESTMFQPVEVGDGLGKNSGSLSQH